MAKILVIDDSPTVSSTLEWMLCNQCHRVSVARDGLTALNALRSFKPDLVLLDIRLPHIDGIQLCTMIRADSRYRNLPVIMLSGLSSQADIQRAFDAGANDYVVKPVNDDTLLMVIDQYLAV
jgi:DNA-binding response OmpR family regulator